MNRPDREQLAEARPFIRSAVALVIYVCRGSSFALGSGISMSYELADEFLDQLEKDLA